MILSNFILILALFVSLLSFAQPLTVVADKVVVDNQKKQTHYQGQAVLTQGAHELLADSIVLLKNTKNQRAMSAKNINSRPVVYKKFGDNPVQITSQKADYIEQKQTFSFADSVLVKTVDTHMDAQFLVNNIDLDELEAKNSLSQVLVEKQLIKIKADKANIHTQNNQGVYSGNVFISQGSSTMAADVVRVTSPKDGGQQIVSYVTSSPFVVYQNSLKNLKITSLSATNNVSAEVMVFSGQVVFAHPSRTLTSDFLRYNAKNQNTQAVGRVHYVGKQTSGEPIYIISNKMSATADVLSFEGGVVLKTTDAYQQSDRLIYNKNDDSFNSESDKNSQIITVIRN